MILVKHLTQERLLPSGRSDIKKVTFTRQVVSILMTVRLVHGRQWKKRTSSLVPNHQFRRQVVLINQLIKNKLTWLFKTQQSLLDIVA